VSPEDVERRLAAILSADAVGYSRLLAEDEVGTVRTLGAYRDEIGLLVRQHRGRVVDAPGDNLLAEFPSASRAASCAVEIHEAEFARLRRKPTRSLSAYEAFIRGLGHWRKVTREGYAEARSHFGRAIELDPEFAAAHASLAATYAADAMVRCPSDLKPPPRVREGALRALALDPFDPTTHFALATLALWEGRTEDALAPAERAAELAPSWDVVHFVLGSALLRSGRPLEAIGAQRRALRLSPRPPAPFLAALGFANYMAGSHEQAVALWERARAANPDLIPVRVLLAAHYEGSGQHEKARGLVQEVLRGNPDCTADSAVSVVVVPLGPEAVRELRDQLLRAGLP
jgi:adenylate cyclase